MTENESPELNYHGRTGFFACDEETAREIFAALRQAKIDRAVKRLVDSATLEGGDFAAHT
jgi:hypothetical protein